MKNILRCKKQKQKYYDVTHKGTDMIFMIVQQWLLFNIGTFKDSQSDFT